MIDERVIRVLPKQARMIECDAVMAAAAGGTGSGKSYAWAIWLWDRIQNFPHANHGVIGAEYDQLRTGFFATFVGILEKIGWQDGVDYRYVDSGVPVIHFPRLGKRVRLRGVSARRAQRLRSVEFQSIVCEEVPTWVNGEEVFSVLTGRLRMSGTASEMYSDKLVPMLRMSFNPPAEGSWVHELLTGADKWPSLGYPYWRLSVRDNHLMAGLDLYIANLKATWNPRRWASEIDGHWQLGGGNVYYGYDPAVHGNPPEGIPPVDWVDPLTPIAWMHDFNVAMMCSIIGQVYQQKKILVEPMGTEFALRVPTWQVKILRFLDEFALKDKGSPEVLEAFLASPWFPIALKQGVDLYGDATGGSRSQTADSRSAAKTNWEIIFNGLRAAGVKVTRKWPNANPPIKDRVNYFNAQFGTAEGPGATININRCKTFVRDLRELNWAANGQDLKKVAGVIGDSSDAGGYFVSWERMPRSRASFAIGKNH